MASPVELAELLAKAYREPRRREALVEKFIRRFGQEPLTGGDEEPSEVLDVIMSRLSYYEPNPAWRREYHLYYGESKLVEILCEGIEELRRRGVTVDEE